MEEIDLYDRIDEATLILAMDRAEWVLATNMKVMEEEEILISNFYGKCSLFGATDYKDHRGDSIEFLRRLSYEGVKDRLMQNIHYYKNGKLFDTVVCKPYRGGWSVYVEWKN